MNNSIKRAFFGFSIVCLSICNNTTKTMQLFKDIDKESNNIKQLENELKVYTRLMEETRTKISLSTQRIKKIEESIANVCKHPEIYKNPTGFIKMLQNTIDKIKKQLNKNIKSMINLTKNKLKIEKILASKKEENKNKEKKKIENTPKNKKEKLKKKEKDQCVICLDEIKNDKECKLLSCFHKFHTKCINEWKATSNKCPICKQSESDILRKEAEINNNIELPNTQSQSFIFNNSNISISNSNISINQNFLENLRGIINETARIRNRRINRERDLSLAEKIDLALELDKAITTLFNNTNVGAFNLRQKVLFILFNLKRLNININPSVNYDQLINNFQSNELLSAEILALLTKITNGKLLKKYITNLFNN